MSVFRLASVAVLAWGAGCFSADAPATQPTPRLAPEIDKPLQQMSALLAGAKSLSFECYAISEQVLADGQKVEFARNQKVTLRRPDAVRASVEGDNEKFEFYYDGKTVTVLNGQTNQYAQAEAPGTIDATLDMLALKYGMVLPLSDMVFSDPYKALTEQVRSGKDLGVGYVFQTKCRHFAIRGDTVDWQIWLEDGPQPWPQKMVITYKEAPAQLQYTAYFRNWKPGAELSVESLKFSPPADAKKVEFGAPASASNQR